MKVPILTNKSTPDQLNLSEGFLVLIDKPMDWTSFDVCKKIRNGVPFKKVGHAGTLDPFATGLLLVGAGKGTKEMTHFSEESKKYKAEIRFGISTDSFDRTGNIIKEEPFNLELDDINKALKDLSGTINQIPPMFSAKKVNGKALYKYARKGIEIERKEVQIQIHDVILNKWTSPLLNISLHVSKGTYIRSYAHDLGMKLGVPATLNELQRTEIGTLKLEDSFSVEEFFEFWNKVSN